MCLWKQGCLNLSRIIFGWRGTLVVGVLLVLLVGCTKTVTWTEEVRLSNGKTIAVKRETRFRPGGAEWPRGDGWKPQRYVIHFNYPISSEHVIEWQSTKTDAERGTDPEFPLLLDVTTADEAPFIITLRGLRGSCFEYVRYVLHDGTWSEDPLPAEFEARDANLYLSAGTVDVPKQVSLGFKQKDSTDIRYRKCSKKIGPKQTDCRA